MGFIELGHTALISQKALTMKSLPLAAFLLLLAFLIAFAYDLSQPLTGKADSKVISALETTQILTDYKEKV